MEKTPTPTTVAERYGLNPCQSAFWNLAAQDQHKFLLAYGGGGSGKSYLILLMFMLTAMAVPKTRFGIFRLTRASCQETLFDKTLGEVFDTAFPGMAQDEEKVKISQSTMEVELANGSLIMFDGLDENRLKKIDGNAYNYVWLNECNEFSYAHVSRLIGRLRHVAIKPDGRQLKNKIFADCNPDSKRDWEYRSFVLGVNPVDGNALANHDQWAAHKLWPRSNAKHLGEDYVETMASTMSAKDRKRYIEGDWSDDNPSSIFKQEWFDRDRFPISLNNGIRPKPEDILDQLEDKGIEFTRKIISVDPAVADGKRDLHGISVVGLAANGHAYVLTDETMAGTPDEVCARISKLYTQWGATRVYFENNQGGTWLEATMRKHFANVPLSYFRAKARKLLNGKVVANSGGKADRADSVSPQYERGFVHHVGALTDLEEQMMGFNGKNFRGSPDRMDAVVWALVELLNLTNSEEAIPGAVQARSSGRRR